MNSIEGLPDLDSRRCEAIPFGRVTLGDMINFQVASLMSLLGLLETEQAMISRWKIKTGQSGEQNLLVEAAIARIRSYLETAQQFAETFSSSALKGRIKKISIRLGSANPITIAEAEIELRVLGEVLIDEANLQSFYHYPPVKAEVLKLFNQEWSEVVHSFPDLNEHLLAAVDCYALGHNKACVFQLMLAMEIGVQKLGQRLGVKMNKLQPGRNVQELTWNDILNAINPALKAYPQHTVAQKRRYERLCQIQSYLYGVKDAWRNPTMHPRSKGYSDLEALGVINNVRDFLRALAAITRRGS